jgi:hypothetical protein
MSLSDKRFSVENCESCRSPYDGRGKGYLYAIATAILCPCHMLVWGALLGGTAAGAFFDQHFWSLAILLGILTLLSLARAIRILL